MTSSSSLRRIISPAKPMSVLLVSILLVSILAACSIAPLYNQDASDLVGGSPSIDILTQDKLTRSEFNELLKTELARTVTDTDLSDYLIVVTLDENEQIVISERQISVIENRTLVHEAVVEITKNSDPQSTVIRRLSSRSPYRITANLGANRAAKQQALDLNIKELVAKTRNLLILTVAQSSNSRD